MKLQIFILGLIAIMTTAGRAADNCINLATREAEVHISAAKQVSKALDAANICHKTRFLPGNRLQQSLIDGEIDGDMGRIMNYGEQVGDIAIMVEEPVVRITGLFISRKNEKRTLDEMRAEPIGAIANTQWAETKLQQHVDVMHAKSVIQLIRLMEHERISGFLIDDFVWHTVQKDYPDLQMNRVVEINIYMWLRKEKADFAQPIAEALRAFKARGNSILERISPQS